MIVESLLPPIAGFRLDDVVIEADFIRMQLTVTAPTVPCPLCDRPATRVHSFYTRTVADLPWAGRVAQLKLNVRKFFCDQSDCRQRIFCERLGAAIASYGRRTQRLTGQLDHLGLNVGSKPGSRLGYRLGLSSSPTTLLRLIRDMPIGSGETPRVVGVDEWAIRKGQRYGLILVDLERHCPVDLLPDQSAATLADWLRQHPGIEVASRDRAKEFAQAAKEALPQAKQVADRFHLLKNLYDAIRKMFDRQPGLLRLDIQEKAPDPHSEGQAGEYQRPPAPTSSREAIFAEVKTLQQQGWNRRQIARHLQLDKRTVARYFRYETYPRKSGSGPKSTIQSYLPYLTKRWTEDGCHNRQQLYAEIQAKGYQGSYMSVLRAIKRALRDGTITQPPHKTATPVERLSATEAAWLLIQPADAL